MDIMYFFSLWYTFFEKSVLGALSRRRKRKHERQIEVTDVHSRT